MNPEEDADARVTPAGADWFEQWLPTGTVAQRSVDIYGRPDLMAEYEQLERELSIAKDIEKQQSYERAAGETPRSVEILERMQKLYDTWMASKSTWFVRTLNTDETKHIQAPVNELTEPGKDASKAKKQSFEEERDKLGELADLQAIKTALVKVEDVHGRIVMESVTVDQLKALKKQIGPAQIARLVQASFAAGMQEAAMPVPLSQDSSRSGRS